MMSRQKLRDVEGYLSEEELGVVRGTLVDLQGVEGTRRISELVEGVSSGLQKFVGWEEKSDSLTGNGIGSNKNGTTYKSSYDKSSSGTTGGSTTDGDTTNSWDKIYEKCTKESGHTDGGISDIVRKNEALGDLTTLARILLGAIPLVFSGLSYLYYTFGDSGLDSTGGGTNDANTRVGQYMQRMGYKIDELVELRLGTLKDGKIEGNVFKKVFKECGILGDKVTVSGNYAQYLEKLRTEAGKKSEQKDGQTTDKHSLLKLNILCSGYFRSLHSLDSIRNPRPRTPRTVREILYWLTSLPYCPIYRTLVPKVQEMIQRIGNRSGQGGSEVIFYGSNVSGNQKVLKVSDGNCASYLLGAALVAPMVLLSIQDTVDCLVGKVSGKPGDSSSNGIPIHDLYANMQFYFSYPMSETQSYYLLQDCLVALYYQMYFLECQTYKDSDGGYSWKYCKYGDQVKCEGKDGTGCLSWICPVGKKEDHDNGTSGPGNTCGTSNPSPLQAFLTDCLKGFTCPVVMEGGYKDKDGKVVKYQENLEKLRKEGEKENKIYSECYPEFLEHRQHAVYGQYCPIPMGFRECFRKAAAGQGSTESAAAGNSMSGLGLNAICAHYANDDLTDSCLYQLVRCICSLTRRVPRSTGTIYGFFYGLGGILLEDYSDKGKEVSKALSTEFLCCPGTRDPKCLMDALFNWRGVTHSGEKDTIAGHHDYGTLDSLHNCGSSITESVTCGWYLRPLTGYLYNSLSDRFCETYVSCIVHLSWRLHEGLQKLRDEFANISCEDCKCAKGTDCQGKGCQKGTHGNPQCCCDNVVECVGVHGLFYRFGFSYLGPSSLGSKKCSQFYTQLGKVIDGNLFDNLFTQLRKFIYSTRALFGVYIGVYWSIVLVYLLWSMTVNLDLVHIQSHWRSPRSYLVPLQRILADGSRKGFCTLGYFQESGDSLVSLGVSDVYL